MKTNYQPFKRMKGSNQYVDIVSVRPEELTLRAVVTLMVFFSVCLWLLTRYMLFVAGNIERVATRDYNALVQFLPSIPGKIQDTFQIVTPAYTPRTITFMSPVTKVWADALVHPQPEIPELTKQQMVENAKHSDILVRIWNNETSQGKNATTDPTALHTYCRSIGKTNEWGFDPQDKYCFDTFQKSVDTVNTWFDTCLKTRTLGACLMRYSGNSESYIPKFINQ